MKFRYIHILAALFLIAGMGVQIIVSYRRASDRVQERMEQGMQIAQEKLIFELYDAYDAQKQMQAFLNEEMEEAEDWLEQTHMILKYYPNLYTCFVAYPPYQGSDSSRWCGLTSYRSGDSILTVKFGDEHHDYFRREWYKGALSDREAGYWTQPYRDEDFDEPIFTYSDALWDENDSLECVIGFDFSVNWLQQLLEQFKPFDDAEFALYSSSGALLTSSGDVDLAHEDKWVLSRKTLDPLDIDIVMAVHQRYIWDSIWLGIVVPLVVFVLGIFVVAFLIRRLVRDAQENARLGTEKEVMAHELQIAHDIQMGMLPKAAVSDERLAISGTLIPMKEVGGDLYDYRLEGDTLWFIIGDVSGKGVPAAMFMSATVNLFRAAGRHSHSPKELMEEINAVLSENNPSLTFVTALIGRLDLQTGEMRYCNAGHCAPLKAKGERLKAKGVESVELKPNIPLGYDGRFEYEEQTMVLQPGQTLVLYTDGITEARNEQRQFFGQKRLEQAVSGDGLPVSGERILQAVRQFMGHAEQTDDITLLTICRSRSNKTVQQP